MDEDGHFTVADRIYDGTTVAEVTDISGLALDGLVGDEYFVIGGVGAAFVQPDAGENVVANLDALSLGTGFNGALAMNYTLSLEGAPSTTATISPRPVQVMADDALRVYGESNAALTYSAESAVGAIGARGLLDGDTLSGHLATTATAGSHVGDYAITQGSLANANYIIEFTNGTLTITPRPVQVAADDASRVYGESNPALSYSAESAADATGARGLLEGDTLSGDVTTTATAGSNAGGHAITQGTLTDAANPNYTIEFVNGMLTITPRPVQVAADDASRVYGESNPALGYVAESAADGIGARGLLEGDTLSGGLATAATAGSDAGGYAITQGTLTDAANPNYMIEFVDGTLTITPRPVQVAANAMDKVYGDHDPVLGFTAEAQSEGRGLVEGDSLNGALARAAGENVGSYAITQGTLTDAANPNYTIEFTGAGLEITQRAIALAADLISRIYGESDPQLSVSIVGGSLGSESVSDTLEDLVGALSRVAGDNVGQYHVLLGEGVRADNYAITFNADNGAFSITPRPVQVAANAAGRTYGDADPALTYSVETQSEGRGLVEGESLDGALVRASGENAGSYAITQGTLTDAANPNYTIEFTGADFEITQRAIALAADLVSRIYGDSDPQLSVSIVGGSLASGSVTDTLEDVVGALSRMAGDDVGQYHVLLGEGVKADNYAITFDADNGAFSITPRQLTVQADDRSKIYGQQDPALTWQIVEGSLLAGDSLGGALSRVPGESIGRYAITAGTLGNPNYALQLIDGTLVIRPQQQSEVIPNMTTALAPFGATGSTASASMPAGGGSQNGGLLLVDVDDQSVGGDGGAAGSVVRDRNGQPVGGYMPVLVVSGGIQLPAGVTGDDDRESDGESL